MGHLEICQIKAYHEFTILSIDVYFVRLRRDCLSLSHLGESVPALQRLQTRLEEAQYLVHSDMRNSSSSVCVACDQGCIQVA